MSSILVISGSPSPASRAGIVVARVDELLRDAGYDVQTLHVRQLPTLSLLTEDLHDQEIADAVSAVLRADGIVVASPVYRAAYSGLVKALLDLLPKKGLRGRVILPLATGGSQGFLVAMDYALNPLLTGKGADQVLRGEFVLDPDIVGEVIAPTAAEAIRAAVDRFTLAVEEARFRRKRPQLRPAV
ncbi:NAD(P)H-dependent oxidoreductase [Actinosynnema sp. NPDC047251]|uniref:NADPH-dependent FMN reductase n=1 Tax=Saccharothrix espanaensis (strain ATCC 51144 / DSM 44229 / JCM 9112 / NBRC 15066 / NRRL 15764) TaxID=1179773 RepID=K0JR88_SACES|nr:NAD(P)H-dependent oxidoreductase [Saccharothrix espanaensis]CCH28296.1 NADPH-dependent FMN reductase [Saccharothrix espanaensis DSM 44229]